MQYVARHVRAFSVSSNRKRRKVWLAVLAALAGIGFGLRLLEVAHPGAIADLLSVIKALWMAIWKMICDVANACAGFMRYVEGARVK